jgi:hypothetical protein
VRADPRASLAPNGPRRYSASADGAPPAFQRLWRLFTRRWRNEKLGNGYGKSLRDSIEQINGRILFLTFKTAKIRAINSGIGRKLLLRNALLDPYAS